MGFIPGRQGPDQVRRAINIVSLLQSDWDGGPRQEGMWLLIDLQKAFDYIFAIMHRWGFDQNFMGLLRALYSTMDHGSTSGLLFRSH